MTVTEPMTEPVWTALPADLRLELANLAVERGTTEGELVQAAVRRFLRSERASGVPRYARRLGPIAD
jgi:hypothetical protein